MPTSQPLWKRTQRNGVNIAVVRRALGFAFNTRNDCTVTRINDLVVGTVNDQQARVTVNGVSAQVTNRTYTAPDIPLQLGANILRIVAMDRTGNSATVSVTVTRTQASGTFIKMLSGNNQTGAISTPLAAPLAVQIFNGVTPVANAPVIFKVTQNNGSLQPGAPQSSLIIVNTDASGQARANFTLGNRAGAGNNLVEAYSTAASGIIPFTASGAPKQAALISVDSGNNQFGAVSQKLVLPLVAVVTDTGYNRLGGIPVTFMSKQGFGTFNGASSWETVSDSDGRALATLTLGTQPGQDNNVVEAYVSASLASGNLGLPALGFPAAFTATARVPGDPAATRISGVVLDNSNQPIPNVTMRLYQANLGNRNNVHTEVVTPVVTDAKGAFKITPAPVGLYKLMADGNTAVSAGKLYPTLEYDIVTVAGQDNTVGMPLYLPALDPLAKVCVNETTGGTLTITSSPGFSLTIQPGAATFPGGAKTGCVTVTPVNFDKMPMSPGFGQQPRYIVTIQPVGTTFNPPAAITIPNMDGLAPRAKTEMYSYDHDLAAFVAIGSATVSNDGSVIASDPGIGVMKAGWHCGGNPNTTGSVGTCPTCKKCSGSQCAADDSQTPPQNSPTDCRQEICLGGSIGSVPKDAEVPTNFCKKCQGGFTVNDPAKQKVSIAALGVTPELCTSPEQNKSLPYNLDGCTWSPDDLASWNSKMLFSTNYHLYVTNPIWGTVLGDISQSVADAQTLPCNVHDVCYQTCGSNKSSCDSGLGAGITASCDIGYPLPCNRVDQTECAGYEEEYRSCKTIGPFYQGVVESSVGSVAYQVDQAKYCYCCKAQ